MPPRAPAWSIAVVLALATAGTAGGCRSSAEPTPPAIAPTNLDAAPEDPGAPGLDARADPPTIPDASPPAEVDARAEDAPLPYPGLNERYRARPRARTWAARFEREGREVYTRRKAILRNLHLRTGQDVADVGAGTGLFTLPIAAAVGPEGKVYAVDLMPTFLAHIGERCRAAGVQNVTLVQSSARATGLAEGSIDLAFLSDSYHHLEDPAAILRSIRRALRPGGELVILDFERIPGVSPSWVFDHVRAGKEVVLAEAEAAGFVRDPVEPEVDFLGENYFIRLRRG
ncbi:MAG: class I SAM-dependent methyltransferase [Nannocystaceae bacterium]